MILVKEDKQYVSTMKRLVYRSKSPSLAFKKTLRDFGYTRNRFKCRLKKKFWISLLSFLFTTFSLSVPLHPLFLLYILYYLAIYQNDG
jgi:hypothetical protein